MWHVSATNHQSESKWFLTVKDTPLKMFSTDKTLSAACLLVMLASS
jgi:hypothetical protein